MVSPSGLAALPPLYQDHRACDQYCRPHKTEWLQGKPKPMKHKKIAESHGYGRHNDDEEGAVHGEKFKKPSLLVQPLLLGSSDPRLSSPSEKTSPHNPWDRKDSIAPIISLSA